MRSIIVLTAAACVLSTLWAAPALAQGAKKQRYYARGGTVVTTVDEFGRRRTRIVVTKRSYLDAGTEVMPGERKYSDYANPPYYSPYSVLGPGRDYSQQPLPNSMGIYTVGPASVW